MGRVIALSGSIGSGKSALGHLIRKWGYPCWDADALGREVLLWDSVRGALVHLFGESVFLSRGELDRKMVRNLIFQDESLKKAMESIIHPAVAFCLEKKKKTLFEVSPDAWAFYEHPLLYEKRHMQEFDAHVLVAASWKVRCERVCASRGLSQEEFNLFDQNQMSMDEKRTLAEFVIENEGLLSLEDLWQGLQKKLFLKFES